MMNNEQFQYYINNLLSCCSLSLATPLQKYLEVENFLSEYQTDTDKAKVIENLGIKEYIDSIIKDINNSEVHIVSALDTTIPSKYTLSSPVYLIAGEVISLAENAYFYDIDKNKLTPLATNLYKAEKDGYIYIAFDLEKPLFSYYITVPPYHTDNNRMYLESLKTIPTITLEEILEITI